MLEISKVYPDIVNTVCNICEGFMYSEQYDLKPLPMKTDICQNCLKDVRQIIELKRALK